MQQQLTDEERKKLIQRLRSLEDHPWELTKQAAGEIERLAKRVTELEQASLREDASVQELAEDGHELKLEYTINRIYALQERYLLEIDRLQTERQNSRVRGANAAA